MISDFQLVLIGIIAVIIVGVIVYNRWQELKYKHRAEQAFGSDSPLREDALFPQDKGSPTGSATRVEPSFGPMHLTAEDAVLNELTAPIGETADGSVNAGNDSGIGEPRPEFGGMGNELAPAINNEIDTVAMILADAPVDADRYAPMIMQSKKIAKNILWEGLVGGLWQPIDPTLDEQYRELRAGMQLADRGGAIDSMMLQNFDEAMANFAGSINAVSQREDVNEAARRAQMVDVFCADSDIEIAINIVGKSGVTFASTKVRGLAEAQGLVAMASGEFALKDDYGRVLFVLRNGNPAESPPIRVEQAYLTQLTFALDVPRTPGVGRVFERMFTLAMQFADVLHGEVVDDNKRVLTAHGRKVIAETIHEITGEMQQKGIAPGSSIALRLYA